MAINLSKGQRVDIGLTKVGIGLGWDPNSGSIVHDFDLDASAFMVAQTGKIPRDEFFVFYNNLLSPDGAVRSTGDDRTGGSSDGDDETLLVDLELVDSSVDQIIFCVSIHEAEARRQNFGQVRASFVRIYDQVSAEEIAKYELEEDFSIESVIEFGRLYRRGGVWRFEAMGIGHQGGLNTLLQKYT
jgi:tellurium resistance protein TerD